MGHLSNEAMRPDPPLTDADGAVAPFGAEPLHLLGADGGEREAWTTALGLERYRAEQIGRWVFEKGADSFEQMSNLSKGARAQCARNGAIYRGRVKAESASADGTRKVLVAWPDGAAVESVWIPEPDRHTACISSQVGCPVGCRFCASGLDGVQRNLTAGEIVEQAMWIRRLVRANAPAANRPAGAGGRGTDDSGDTNDGAAESGAEPRLSNVVLMGMGEPLANYDAVVKALRIINAPDGLGIGARKITLSTVGLPAQIRKLAREGLQINLALSLHAPDDELRHELIPWGKGVPIRELIEACKDYFRQTGREVTIEYVLLEGVNNLPRHADRLAAATRSLRCNVNLLRYNPVAGTPFQRPSAESAFEFQRLLRARGVNAHIRKSRGADVDAACGQLRRSTQLTIGAEGGLVRPGEGADRQHDDGAAPDEGAVRSGDAHARADGSPVHD